MNVQNELREIFNTDTDCILADFPIGNKFVIDGELMEVVAIEFEQFPEYSTYLYTLRGSNRVMRLFERDLWHTLDKQHTMNIEEVQDYYTRKIENRKFRIVSNSTSLVLMVIEDDKGNETRFNFWYEKQKAIRQIDIVIAITLTEKAEEVLKTYFID